VSDEPTAEAVLARLAAEADEHQRVAYRRYFPGEVYLLAA
jgi:hypothetical protein